LACASLAVYALLIDPPIASARAYPTLAEQSRQSAS
jgi:hypothetical protein